MKNGNGEAGFIIAEMIAVLGLSAIITAVLMTVFFSAYKLYQYQLAFTDIQYAERAAMQMMIEDIMTAHEVECLNEGRTLRLLLEDGYVSYYVQNQTVYRHGAAKMPVVNCISSLSFQPGSQPGYIRIYMEAWQGEKTNRIICSANSRLVTHTETADPKS
jgi:type II secretory pathway pseudopilin PulG